MEIIRKHGKTLWLTLVTALGFILIAVMLGRAGEDTGASYGPWSPPSGQWQSPAAVTSTTIQPTVTPSATPTPTTEPEDGGSDGGGDG